MNEGGPAFFEVLAWQNLRLHHHGNEIFGIDAHNGPVEILGSHTDYRERVAVEVNRATQHFRIGTKTARPQSMAENYIRIRIQSLVWHRMKCASHGRLNAENVEIIFRGDDSPHTFPRSIIAQAHVHAG